MNGIVVTADLQVSVCDLPYPAGDTLRKIVGGYIEHVSPQGLEDPYCMIVNEEGLLEGLPVNLVGSILYGTQSHGQPIVGTIVIVKDGWVQGERDIVGLDDSESAQMLEEVKQVIGLLQK